jgi:hypothetical protein
VEQTRSALASFGITIWPNGGSKEENAEQGYDLRDVATCSEPEKEKNRGCPMWADCRFNHQSMGGFKGKGARYVAVRQIIPVDGAKGGSQDIKRCFDYVLTLQARADAGAAERRVTNGRRGEVIRIIGQEGDSFTTQWYVGFNAKNEVIQPKPEDIPILKENKINYSTVVNDQAVVWKFIEVKRTVPRMPRPGEPMGDSFAHRVSEWDIENEARDRGFVEAASVPNEEEAAFQKSDEVVSEPVRKAK